MNIVGRRRLVAKSTSWRIAQFRHRDRRSRRCISSARPSWPSPASQVARPSRRVDGPSILNTTVSRG